MQSHVPLEEEREQAIHSGEGDVKMERRESWTQAKECYNHQRLEETGNGFCPRAYRKGVSL